MKKLRMFRDKLLSQIKASASSLLHDTQDMDELVFTRFLWYAVFLFGLFLLAIFFAIYVGLEAAILPAIGFLGIGCMAVSFYRLYKKDGFVIVYGICDSRDSYTPNLLDRYHAITDRKRKKHEYRIMVLSPDGKESFIYMILDEYNRMREGASYKMLFRKTEDGEFSENNLVTFKQLQQDIKIYPSKSDDANSPDKDGEGTAELPETTEGPMSVEAEG